MTTVHLAGTLSISMHAASYPASNCSADPDDETDPLKRRDTLNAYFSEGIELNEIDSFQVFQNKPGKPRQQATDVPAIYEFVVAQSLPDQWVAWFDGLELARDDQGGTLLSGTILDQAALHGVLTKIRDLNLTLLSVRRK